MGHLLVLDLQRANDSVKFGKRQTIRLNVCLRPLRGAGGAN